MTAECYYKQCPFHSIHTIPDDGPFCYEPKCLATEQKMVEWQKERNEELKAKGLPSEKD